LRVAKTFIGTGGEVGGELPLQSGMPDIIDAVRSWEVTVHEDLIPFLYGASIQVYCAAANGYPVILLVTPIDSGFEKADFQLYVGVSVEWGAVVVDSDGPPVLLIHASGKIRRIGWYGEHWGLCERQ